MYDPYIVQNGHFG